VVEAITAAGGKAVAVQGDVSKADQAKGWSMPRSSISGGWTCWSTIRRLRILADRGVTEEQYRKMFDVNVLGVLLTTQAAVPHLGEGGERDQHLVGGHQPLAAIGGLYRHQGRGGRDHRRARQRARPAQDPRQRDQSRVVETEGTHSAGFIGSEFETGIGRPDPARPHRPAGRHRRRSPCSWRPTMRAG
jgi:3-oxoacyl-[acyl-carrier protein] reductase